MNISAPIYPSIYSKGLMDSTKGCERRFISEEALNLSSISKRKPGAVFIQDPAAGSFSVPGWQLVQAICLLHHVIRTSASKLQLTNILRAVWASQDPVFQLNDSRQPAQDALHPVFSLYTLWIQPRAQVHAWTWNMFYSMSICLQFTQQLPPQPLRIYELS